VVWRDFANKVQAAARAGFHEFFFENCFYGVVCRRRGDTCCREKCKIRSGRSRRNNPDPIECFLYRGRRHRCRPTRWRKRRLSLHIPPTEAARYLRWQTADPGANLASRILCARHRLEQIHSRLILLIQLAARVTATRLVRCTARHRASQLVTKHSQEKSLRPDKV